MPETGRPSEAFKPLAHRAPGGGVWEAALFWARVLLDLQVHTVFLDLRAFARSAAGKVVDFGCGDSPYRHLFPEGRCEYIGLDSTLAPAFDYPGREILRYDGGRLPFEDGAIDCFVSTETFEHVPDPMEKAREVLRVLRPGGRFFLTVPWSARFHYQPHDYYRYTPTALRLMFQEALELEVRARGTDVSVICAKIVVVCLRGFSARGLSRVTLLPLALLGLIPAALAVLLGHLSLLTGLGSADDPLGYTVTGVKPGRAT